MNVNMTREFSVHWIIAHRNASKVVFLQNSRFSLRKLKIGQRFTELDRFLTCWASCDKFSLGSRKRHVVLSSTFPRNGSTIHHENVSCVRSASVSVSSPIRIYPTPQNVRVFVRITRVANWLIPSAAKIAQNVFGSKHVILSWKLYILTVFLFPFFLFFLCFYNPTWTDVQAGPPRSRRRNFPYGKFTRRVTWCR